MKTILLIHGPNLNLLGQRDHKFYGSLTLKQLENLVKRQAGKLKLAVKTFQSNHEGALIDFLQKNAASACGIIINPGALAHYSFALHDALLDAGLPAVEVHLSDISKREAWRRKSVISAACAKVIAGKKERGYVQALGVLKKIIDKQL
jgi:3-dehydroquinate dehydratase-2